MNDFLVNEIYRNCQRLRNKNQIEEKLLHEMIEGHKGFRENLNKTLSKLERTRRVIEQEYYTMEKEMKQLGIKSKNSNDMSKLRIIKKTNNLEQQQQQQIKEKLEMQQEVEVDEEVNDDEDEDVTDNMNDNDVVQINQDDNYTLNYLNDDSSSSSSTDFKLKKLNEDNKQQTFNNLDNSIILNKSDFTISTINSANLLFNNNNDNSTKKKNKTNGSSARRISTIGTINSELKYKDGEFKLMATTKRKYSLDNYLIPLKTSSFIKSIREQRVVRLPERQRSSLNTYNQYSSDEQNEIRKQQQQQQQHYSLDLLNDNSSYESTGMTTTATATAMSSLNYRKKSSSSSKSLPLTTKDSSSSICNDLQIPLTYSSIYSNSKTESEFIRNSTQKSSIIDSQINNLSKELTQISSITDSKSSTNNRSSLSRSSFKSSMMNINTSLHLPKIINNSLHRVGGGGGGGASTRSSAIANENEVKRRVSFGHIELTQLDIPQVYKYSNAGYQRYKFNPHYYLPDGSLKRKFSLPKLSDTLNQVKNFGYLRRRYSFDSAAPTSSTTTTANNDQFEINNIFNYSQQTPIGSANSFNRHQLNIL